MIRIAALLFALLPLAARAQSPVITQPFGAATTQTAGTITLGGTFQTALAASANRKGCMIQNTGVRTLHVFFGPLAGATTAKAIQVAPGGAVSCSVGGIVLTDAVNVVTTTTADTYVLAAQ